MSTQHGTPCSYPSRSVKVAPAASVALRSTPQRQPPNGVASALRRDTSILSPLSQAFGADEPQKPRLRAAFRRREWRAPPRADGRSLARALPADRRAGRRTARQEDRRRRGRPPARRSDLARAHAQPALRPGGSPRVSGRLTALHCELDRASEASTNLIRPQPALER